MLYALPATAHGVGCRCGVPVLMCTCAGGLGWMEECTWEGSTPIWCCCATNTRSSKARSFLLPLLAVLPAFFEMW